MKLNSLPDLLIHELQDLCSAEQQLTEALPKMAKAAKNPMLKQAFESHLKETLQQLEQVQSLLDSLDATPGRHKCAAMAGIIKEGEDILKADGEDSVKDAAIISAAQRVEHYEIAGYGTARTLAATLGHENVARTLERILEQEHAADEKLSEISSQVNEMAAQAMQGQSDQEGGSSGGGASGSGRSSGSKGRSGSR
jgi:ferritin-like metal-binding protein YciE